VRGSLLLNLRKYGAKERLAEGGAGVLELETSVMKIRGSRKLRKKD
jgi:hypothetical protein